MAYKPIARICKCDLTCFVCYLIEVGHHDKYFALLAQCWCTIESFSKAVKCSAVHGGVDQIFAFALHLLNRGVEKAHCFGLRIMMIVHNCICVFLFSFFV